MCKPVAGADFLQRGHRYNLACVPADFQSLVTQQLDKLLTRTIRGSEICPMKMQKHILSMRWILTSPLMETLKLTCRKFLAKIPFFAFLKPTLSGTIVLGATNEFAGCDRRTTPDGLAAIMKK